MRLFIIVFLFVLVGCATGEKEGYGFRLKGNVIYCDATEVGVWEVGGSAPLLTVPMRNGRFELEGMLPERGEYILKIGDRKMKILLDGDDMELHANYEDLTSDFLYGSPAKQAEQALHLLLETKYNRVIDSMVNAYTVEAVKTGVQDIDVLGRKVQELGGVRKALIESFIRENAGSIYMPLAIEKYMEENPVWGKELFDLVSPDIRQSLPGRLLNEKLDYLTATAIGVPFKAFEAVGRDGQTVQVGGVKGKVCVIDFWASWCGPCREEMQYLKQLYQELAGEDVCFYSISLDKKKDAWLKADKEEQLAWQSLWLKDSFESPVCKSLCIEAIPFILVIDRDGRIAGKKLRDEALKELIRSIV